MKEASIGKRTKNNRRAINNCSKSNHDFNYNDQRYFRRAPLKTQNELSEFINRETGRWDETSIGQRTEKILAFAKNHWNHNAV